MLKFYYGDETVADVGMYNGIRRYKYIICLDEVGRGPLLGKVFISAVALNMRFPETDIPPQFSQIKDSKKFSSKTKLKNASNFIWELNTATAEHENRPIIAVSVESVDETVIDNINILQSVFQGMHKCIHSVFPKIKDDMDKRGEILDVSKDILIMVDGNLFKPFYLFLDDNMVQIPHITIEKGDGKYIGIAAASIVAKVAHDEYIYSLCEKYPELSERYNLHKNVGYGTREHLEGIRKYGITQFHRKTFGTCKNTPVNPVVCRFPEL